MAVRSIQSYSGSAMEGDIEAFCTTAAAAIERPLA
jgi:hypothetical protein